MQYKYLGRTGVQISQLGLGTMNFGDLTDETTSFKIMDEALEVSINYIDTADVYGGPQSPDMEKGYGISEEIIGRWLSQGGRRDHIVLATKVYQPMGNGPNDRHLSAYHIRKACEDSLRRLQTDRIDLYQMHHVDRLTPWEEIWQAMEVLVHQGKVIYVGSSNFAAWDIATAQCAASARHFMGLVSEQSLYNLGARTVELEVIPPADTTAWASSPGVRSVAACWAGRCARPRRAAVPLRVRRSSGAGPSWSPMKRSVRSLVKAPRTSRWPGCCTTLPSRPRSPGRAPWSNWPGACGP